MQEEGLTNEGRHHLLLLCQMHDKRGIEEANMPLAWEWNQWYLLYKLLQLHLMVMVNPNWAQVM